MCKIEKVWLKINHTFTSKFPLLKFKILNIHDMSQPHIDFYLYPLVSCCKFSVNIEQSKKELIDNKRVVSNELITTFLDE